eukprot:TRINITY_DN6525_c0_g1_i1.p1 TRINITY_DN6525_c0_g1~~TRINITY_DN6525_c0_g1_i1.p1  ORF type:complete len:207 (+),score=31.01 TRINITY_DN6525_c0_g1_i1:162-782(+)
MASAAAARSRSSGMSQLADWNGKIVYPLMLSMTAVAGYGAWRAYTVYPQLPAVVASHFNFYGVADSTASKEYLVPFVGVLYGFVVGSFLYSAFKTRKDPKLKNKEKAEYWLGSGDPRWASSEERKRRGDAVTTLATHSLLAGNAVVVLLADIFDQVWKASLEAGATGTPATIGQRWMVDVGVFAAVQIGATVWASYRLRVPKKKTA